MKRIEKLDFKETINSNGQIVATGAVVQKLNELVDAINLFFTPTFFEVKEEPRNEEINQCDGCRRGITIKDGVHQGNSVWDLQACTKDKYKPTLAEQLEKAHKEAYYSDPFKFMASVAKKAFEEAVLDWVSDTDKQVIKLPVLRELIERIRRM